MLADRIKGGPAYLKQIGVEPLFKDKEEGTNNCYESVFNNELDYDELYRQTILFLALENSLYSMKKVRGIPKEYKKFKNASENFVFGVFWRAIRGNPDLQDLKYNNQETPRIKSMAASLVSGLFELVKTPLKNGIAQNDIFRGR